MKIGFNIISLWFSALIVVLVIAGAIALLFTDFMIDRVYGSKRIIMIIVFLAYAVYRGIRIYQTIKLKDEE